MPEHTKVARCVKELMAKGKSKASAIRICQASTGQSYKTGMKPKHTWDENLGLERNETTQE